MLIRCGVGDALFDSELRRRGVVPEVLNYGVKLREAAAVGSVWPGGHHLEAVRGALLQQHLRHLGAGGIAGADQQDAGFPETVLPGHNASPCRANSCA